METIPNAPENASETPDQPPAPPPGGNRNAIVLAVVILVVTGMLLAGKYLAHNSMPSPEGNSGITKGASAPDFELKDLDGKPVRLSSLKGKAVVLNFWATWCGPCKIEMPWFVELQNEYGPQGFQIVGVAMDDSSKEDIAKFAKDMGVNYPVLIGKEAVGDEYGGVPALPESFFISRDGKILDKFIGLRGKAEVEDAIKAALDTKPASNSAAGPGGGPTQQAQN
jgi:peroxiredoxin